MLKGGIVRPTNWSRRAKLRTGWFDAKVRYYPPTDGL
jgi:hypothetical protein